MGAYNYQDITAKPQEVEEVVKKWKNELNVNFFTQIFPERIIY